MANRTFYLKVYASDRIFFEGQCQTLVIPQSDGLRAIQAKHEDMVLAVDMGEAHIVEEDGTVTYVVVGSGMVQIFHNRAIMLVDTAELPDESDSKRAGEALERAKEQLRQKQSIQEHKMSQASLARALTRLKESSKYNA